MFIYIIGFPGSGKLSIATELSKEIKALVMDNSMFNNIAFNIVDDQLFTKSEVPIEFWDRIFDIRETTLKIIEEYPTSSGNYIFTNELLKGDEYDMRVYNSVVNLSKRMKARIVPVVLHCDENELRKRIVSTERRKAKKITDVDFSMSRIKGKEIFIPPSALEIDNSELTPEEVVKMIIGYIKKQDIDLCSNKQFDLV